MEEERERLLSQILDENERLQAPLRNSLGNVIGTVTVAKDISGAKHFEEALRNSEEKFREAQEHSPDGFTIFRPVRDESGQIVDFIWIYENAAIARLNGTDPNVVVGRRLLDFFPNHRGSSFLQAYLRVAETGEPCVFEDEYGSDSMPKPTWFRIVVVRMGGDIAVLAQDVSERRRAEEALHKALRREKVLGELSSRLLESEDPQIIMEDICRKAISYAECDIFVNYIAEGGRLRLNAYAGIPAEESEKIKWLEYGEAVCGCVARDGARIIVADVQNSTDRRVAFVKSLGIQSYASFPLKTDDDVIGTLSFGSSRQTAFTNDELQFMNIVSGHIAIAMSRLMILRELRESEQKARTLVAELEKADRNKNEFISVLSHELRNPLSAISTGVQILDISQDIKKIDKAKEIMKRQTNQLCKLVDDLLELTRITQNKIKLKKEYINLNDIAKGAAEDVKPGYEKKGLKLYMGLQAQPIFLSADPVRVAQMIGNILFNALKFTPESGEVRLSLKQEKNEAVLIVKDNGVGINPEILPHIFTPFTQAENTLDRSAGGLGLGLSIVKGIVDLHQGSVSAESEGLGKGSTFTIRLPITAGDKQLFN